MKILVLGAGGVGGYFGGRLAEAGEDVTFLVRQARAAQLTEEGLVIDSPLGGCAQSVNIMTEGQEIGTADIILIACKSYGLSDALDAVAPCAGSSTVLLPLLNGISHLSEIQRRFPDVVLWGGLAQIGVTLTPQGHIHHFNKLHGLLFGRLDGVTDRKADAFLSILKNAAINGDLRRNIEQDLWDKMVFLSTLAGSTCLMRADVGTILKTAYGEQFVLDLLEECGAIASAEGYRSDPEQMQSYRRQLTEAGSPSTASMLRDIERNGPTEADHILGDMVVRSNRHGLAVPALKTAFAHLQAYEISRQSQST